MLKNAARNSQFDFSLIKLIKFEFPHKQTTWMMLICVTRLVSPILLSKFKLEELEFSSTCVISNCSNQGQLSSGTSFKLIDHLFNWSIIPK